MGKTSAIEWTDSTWNPWVGCTKVSAGCKNCYMFRDQTRFGNDPGVLRRTTPKTFNSPIRWAFGRVIFVCSWSDFFHPDVPTRWRSDALEVITTQLQHRYLLLTKRPENVRFMVPNSFWLENPHVWLGVSVESQKHIDRLPWFYDIPAAGKFLSVEPMLGPLDLSEHMGFVDWVIAGGESGPGFRKCEVGWVWNLAEQCSHHDVPFFFKQWGGTKKIDGAWGGNKLADTIFHEFPDALKEGG